jgi:hypothetical protein
MTNSRFAVAILLTATLAFAEDPFVGTWKLDLNKTKINATAPKSWKTEISFKVEAVGPNQHHVTGFSADGKVTETHENIFDGKERQDAQGLSHREIRIDERRVRITTKGPKGTLVSNPVVSDHGETLTEAFEGNSPLGGRPMDGVVLVWRKQ